MDIVNRDTDKSPDRSYQQGTSLRGIVIWRVRRVSCDGGIPGREWSAEFFLDESKALDRLMKLIEESNVRNPKYPFKEQQEELDGIRGYCNWQFGIMLTMDAIEVS